MSEKDRDATTGPTPPDTLESSAEVGTGSEADATDRAEENVTPGQAGALPADPEQLGPEVVGVRTGMFGVRGSGDTSGYGGLVRPVAMPGSSPRPFGGWFDAFADTLEQALGDQELAHAVEKVVVHRGELTLFVRRGDLLALCWLLRDQERLRFEFCSSVSGVHHPDDAGRELHVAYHLLSMTHNRRIRLEVTCPDADPHVPSVVAVYPTADWQERETFDFFGVVFDGHPGLTRIQMPDDWPGHPQRKDYPLGGIPVEYKGATIPPPDTRRSYN